MTMRAHSKSLMYLFVWNILFVVYAFEFPRFSKFKFRSIGLHDVELDSSDDLAPDARIVRQQGNRFWVASVPYNSDSNTVSNQSFDDIKTALSKSGLDLSQVEVGIALFPTSDRNLTKVVPIHDGLLQMQHTSYQALSSGSIDGASSVTVCGFYPRAAHVNREEEDERPMDTDRFHALNQALLATYNITHTELLEERYTGTPPSRIYRSFVYPRVKPNYLLESAEKASLRVAAQIEMAIRQLRADEAEYLRNTDKEIISARDIQPVAFLLDNLRSAFNVGSIFRTAETGGVKEIVTAGITPHPPNPKLRKTAFSAVDVVASTHFEDVMKAVEYLKSNGYKIAVMETTEGSQTYTDVEYPHNTVLVVGNELTGVDTRVIELADMVIQIPTYGIKNSLNVASAAPIVLYEVLRQWRAKKKHQ